MRLPDLAPAALLLALLVTSPASGAPEGPPYFDPARGIEKQQDAAKEARGVVKKGPAALEEVLMLMADPSAYVRDDVVEELVESWTESQLVELAKGLRVKDPFIAATVAEVLGLRKLEAAREDLEKALRGQKDQDVLTLVCWALGEIGSPQSWPALEQVAKKAKDDTILKGEAVVALSRCDPKKAVPYLSDLMEDRSPTARIAALYRLGELDEEAAVDAAQQTLRADLRKMKEWRERVLFQACETLRGLKGRAKLGPVLKEAVHTLIELMEEADGRLKHELGWTLREITGKQLADEPSSWKAWWGAKGATFEFTDVPEGHDVMDSEEAGSGGGSVLRYFNIPIYSKRLTFMLDLSGGMDRPLAGQGKDGPARITIAKEELKKTLEKLPGDTATNVLFFASAYYAAAPRLVPVDRMRGQLIQYVDAQQIPTKTHSNRGNIFCTLKLALQQPTIDTVFMLTEGNPTEGQFIDLDRFCRHLRIINRYTKTRVHALFIGSARSAERYLTTVAETTGGRFYDVRTMR